jgi:negative regulator of flagellin synthesis FlgM
VKIDPALRTPLAHEPAEPPAPSRTRAGAPAPASASVQVALSTSEPEGAYDAARVAEIRQAIVNGSLRIDPEAIAERLLEAAQELMRPACL